MITQYTKETLKNAIKDEDVLYPTTSLIADKLRAIYTLFGWVHMLKEFGTTQETVEELIMDCFQSMDEDGKTHCLSTAGLMIEGYFDEEGYVNIDYYFSLD